MSWATSRGWETIGTWLDGISMLVAPMRSANCRSAAGGIASSSAATRYQDGSVFQAGTPITSPKADVASGCCTAYITFALTWSTSAAGVSAALLHIADACCAAGVAIPPVSPAGKEPRNFAQRPADPGRPPPHP